MAWARAVKARQRKTRRAADQRGRGGVPPLWLFTDQARLPDPLPAIAALPKGLAGVVLRPEGAADPRQLGRAVARLCRARRLMLVVAGQPGLAHELRAGAHLRGGYGHRARHRCGIHATSSAHGMAEAIRARRAGAGLIFVSPVFATRSHPGARALGALRWARIVRCSVIPGAALGGISGITVRYLPPRFCHAVGAIGALAI